MVFCNLVVSAIIREQIMMPVRQLTAYKINLCKILLALVLFFAIKTGFSKAVNSHLNDSLYDVYFHSSNDSLKINSLLQLVNNMEMNAIDSIQNKSVDDFLQIANNLAKDSLAISKLAYDVDMLGVKLRNNGKYTSALIFHNWAHEIAVRINNIHQHSIIYNNKGVVYRRLDDYQTALSNHIRALQLSEETQNLKSQAIAINSIGNIHMMIGNLDESLSNFNRSLILEQKLNDKLGIAINLNNIGNVYAQKQNMRKALEYYNLSLNVNREINSQKGIAICYTDIGRVYETIGQPEKALANYLDALEINIHINDKHSLAYSYLQAGELYTDIGEYDIALKYLIPGLDISMAIGSKSFIMDSYAALYRINRARKNYEKAFNYLELSHIYHDSINNIKVRKDIARLQIKYESERKENLIALLERNAVIDQLDIKRQKTISILTLLAFIIALGFVIFLSYYLYNKNKTNKLLLERNRIIEKTRAELDNYSKQLLKAKQEAEHNSKAKGDFLANMSHEIRTPLNSVLGFAELLSESVTEPEQFNHLKVIKSSGRTLLTLINDILDLSKIEAGKFTIDYEDINPEILLEEIIQIFSHKSLEKDILLVNNISPELPTTIHFSELRLRQILFNLVGNAIKFTHNGSIIVDAYAEETEDNEYINLFITISDTGIGIKKEDLKRIFEPFSQSEANKNKQGTGLGLAITKRLIKMMNGSINVISQEGIGTKFNIFFPNVKVVNDMISTSTNSLYNVVKNEFLNILVISDNQINFKNGTFKGLIDVKKEIVNDVEHAKLKISNKNVVILVGMSKVESIAAISTLKQISGFNKITYLVITNEETDNLISTGEILWLSDGISEKEMVQTLNSVITRHSIIDKSSIYFSEFYNNNATNNFVVELSKIYKSYFLTAFNTKMSGSIHEFASELLKIAKAHHSKGLEKYCNDLSAKIHSFEIDEIDILLNLFNTNYHTIVNNKKT
jgi:signal transduction histidine kinase